MKVLGLGDDLDTEEEEEEEKDRPREYNGTEGDSSCGDEQGSVENRIDENETETVHVKDTVDDRDLRISLTTASSATVGFKTPRNARSSSSVSRPSSSKQTRLLQAQKFAKSMHGGTLSENGISGAGGVRVPSEQHDPIESLDKSIEIDDLFHRINNYKGAQQKNSTHINDGMSVLKRFSPANDATKKMIVRSQLLRRKGNHPARARVASSGKITVVSVRGEKDT